MTGGILVDTRPEVGGPSREIENFREWKDAYLKKSKYRNRLIDKLLTEQIQQGVRYTQQGIQYEFGWQTNASVVAKIMNDTQAMIKESADECREAKVVLEDLANDIRALNDVVGPTLADHIKAIRSARMTAIAEIQQTLIAMKEIRKFFLDGDYQFEMDRLKKFVEICRAIKALKEDGTLDAICNSAVAMALKEKV